MRKPLTLIVLMGIGWLIAITPSVWWLLVYSIPIIALSLLVAAFKIWLSTGGSKHY